jgi:hypothetical protein
MVSAQLSAKRNSKREGGEMSDRNNVLFGVLIFFPLTVMLIGFAIIVLAYIYSAEENAVVQKFNEEENYIVIAGNNISRAEFKELVAAAQELVDRLPGTTIHIRNNNIDCEGAK